MISSTVSTPTHRFAASCSMVRLYSSKTICARVRSARATSRRSSRAAGCRPARGMCSPTNRFPPGNRCCVTSCSARPTPNAGAAGSTSCTRRTRSAILPSCRRWRANSASSSACCGEAWAAEAASPARNVTCFVGRGRTVVTSCCGTCRPMAMRSAPRCRARGRGCPTSGKKFARRWCSARRGNMCPCSSAPTIMHRTPRCRGCATCLPSSSPRVRFASHASMNSSRLPRAQPLAPLRASCAGRTATPGPCRASIVRAHRSSATTAQSSCSSSASPSP